jgi:hypothetical protein
MTSLNRLPLMLRPLNELEKKLPAAFCEGSRVGWKRPSVRLKAGLLANPERLAPCSVFQYFKEQFDLCLTERALRGR